MKNELIIWLQKWYESNCNNDWEHSYGIKIETIDNPGWSVKIDISETKLQTKNRIQAEIDQSKNNWIHYKTTETHFEGACSPNNLEELLSIFREFAEK